MPERRDLESQLRSLAFLYLAMGHGTDNYLSGNELDAITDRLHARHAGQDRAVIQDLVGEAMAVYMQSEDVVGAALGMIGELYATLSDEQRQTILDDLLAVAQADGVVLHNERLLMTKLAETWGIPVLPSALQLASSDADATGDWDVLHHLALIYLLLAHGTDNDLSDQERAVMLKKLEEWAPRLDRQEIQEILNVALSLYARGVSDELFKQAVNAVKEDLPHEQRMAALDDLVKIANADGVFLDREEDLINQLLTAWDVKPYANYGRHGNKAARRTDV